MVFPCIPSLGEEGVCDETETEAFLSISQGLRDIYTAISVDSQEEIQSDHRAGMLLR